jgi:hypothetical protein
MPMLRARGVSSYQLDLLPFLVHLQDIPVQYGCTLRHAIAHSCIDCLLLTGTLIAMQYSSSLTNMHA